MQKRVHCNSCKQLSTVATRSSVKRSQKTLTETQVPTAGKGLAEILEQFGIRDADESVAVSESTAGAPCSTTDTPPAP